MLSKIQKEVLDAILDNQPTMNGRYYEVSVLAQVPYMPSINYPEYLACLDTLSDHGYLKWGDQQRTVFSLTDLAYSKEDLEKQRCIERWKDRLWGFTSGVFVTLVAEVIIRHLYF
jgi:hypothetical protein